MKLQVERVDFDDDVTYEVSYENKRFHVVFRESDHLDSGLNVKTEAYKYVKSVNDYDRLQAENEVLKKKLEKCKEQRNGLCEGYSTHSVVEIKLYDQELDAIERLE